MEKYPQNYYDAQGNIIPKKFAYLNISSPSTGALVAADSGGKRIAVFYLEVRADVDATTIAKSGTTVIDATEYIAAKGGSNRGNPDNQTPIFTTKGGEALNITATGAGNVSVRCTYAIIP